MMKRLALSLVALLSLAGCGSSNTDVVGVAPTTNPPLASEFEARGTGYVELTNAERAAIPKALDPALSSVRPKLGDPPNLFLTVPPVGDQGQTGACTAFGAGYGLVTMVTNTTNRDISNQNFCASPTWFYLTVLNATGHPIDNNGHTPGIGAPNLLNTAVNLGGVSSASLPFPAPGSAPAEISELEAINATLPGHVPSKEFALGGWAQVLKIQPVIKRHLAAGTPVTIGIKLPLHLFAEYKTGVFNPAPNLPLLGSHCMVIYGYDDNLQAFAIQNSWGPNWGEGGRMWWSYDSFMSYLIDAFAGAPISTEAVDTASGSTGNGVEVVRAHQVQGEGGVSLVALVRLPSPVKLEHYTLVSPSGLRAQSPYGLMLRSGYLHLTRTDGRQWPAGAYTLELSGVAPDGSPVTRSARLTLAPLAGLAAADTPAGVKGTNDLPVSILSFP